MQKYEQKNEKWGRQVFSFFSMFIIIIYFVMTIIDSWFYMIFGQSFVKSLDAILRSKISTQYEIHKYMYIVI